MWFVYSVLYCEIELVEMCGGMSVLKKIKQQLGVLHTVSWAEWKRILIGNKSVMAKVSIPIR